MTTTWAKSFICQKSSDRIRQMWSGLKFLGKNEGSGQSFRRMRFANVMVLNVNCCGVIIFRSSCFKTPGHPENFGIRLPNFCSGGLALFNTLATLKERQLRCHGELLVSSSRSSLFEATLALYLRTTLPRVGINQQQSPSINARRAASSLFLSLAIYSFEMGIY